MGAVQLEMHEPVAEVVVADAAVKVDFKMVDAIQEGVSSSSGPGLALDQKPLCKSMCGRTDGGSGN